MKPHESQGGMGMKVECKLQDYSCEWKEGKDRVIVERPWNSCGNVQIKIGDEVAVVDADDLRHAINACEEE